MPTARSEFRNTRDFHIGVVTRREDNKMKGLALGPHDTVWLDEEEQIATANAPRHDSDNPFANGDLELLTPATVVSNRRKIGFSEHPNPDEVTRGQEAAPADDPGGSAGGAPEGSPEPAGDESEGAGSTEAEKPQESAEEAEGRRNRTKAEEEENARQAASRRRPAAAKDQPSVPAKTAETTGTEVQEVGEKAQGQRAAKEEVATPEAVGASKGS